MPSANTIHKVALLVIGALFIAIIVAFVVVRQRRAQPEPGSAPYEQASRAFYRGLAALEVGLLDNARMEFGRATQAAPSEPAAWANLGLTELRLGELDAAGDPINRAMSLAPDDSDVVLLAGRMEIARGQIDQGVTLLRRAVELDPKGLRARFALAEEVERAGGPAADRDALGLQNELLRRSPGNLAVLLERTRLAARLSDAATLRDSLTRIQPLAASWPVPAAEQLEALRRAAAASDFPAAARTTVLLRNVLARVPAYGESLTAVRPPTELIADPFTHFIRLRPASSTPDAADTALTFDRIDMRGNGTIAVFPLNADESPVAAVFDGTTLTTIAGAEHRWTLPPTRVSSSDGILPLDWDHDFRTDLLLAGPDGVRLLLQDEGGAFHDATAAASGGIATSSSAFGAWAADIEMDGDLDVVVGETSGPTIVLRNNGDGTWRPLQTFASVTSARGFAWADLDGDGDPDAALLDAAGRVHVFINRQAGLFSEVTGPAGWRDIVAMTVADMDGDDSFDVVTLDASGALRAASMRVDPAGSAAPSWDETSLGAWDGLAGGAIAAGTYHLFAGDLDNNGAIDLVGSGGGVTRAWLANERYEFRGIEAPPADVDVVVDLDGDGRLDLIGRVPGQLARFAAHGTKGYHWKALRARAQERAGDQRINAFGVGGQVEVRSGLLVQKQLLTGMPAHFGLGSRSSIDVARIVWPNGVPQAEFDLRVDDAIVAQQRLKGSCPWVFTYDGHGMRFVTDFLWRSPLGLRINAQDTAGVSQTEDWVKIAGDQLVPRNGAYDVRITAELWETHFFDHVALMVVDHPQDTDVFVDERFSATRPPALAVKSVRVLQPVAHARDNQGRDVTDIVSRPDGRYLSGFELGKYQGIAREHSVEFDVPGDLPRDGSARLLAHGWVYPTDSSINVAIGQGHVAEPRGLSLDAQDASGTWHVVDPDIGFPAGKNKTMVIDVSRAAGATRLRLRTNLEVYWDSLTWAAEMQVPVKMQRLSASTAELRYRGFSETTSPRGDTPETPAYERLANTAPRWRDLTGYYTRFGDVKELIAGVDDRYVIMNAGDELRMQFPAAAAPGAGWRRDYVLMGDGWEKDGDYNTSYSSTVVPLPTHAHSTYTEASASLMLEDDPVYRQHRDDWSLYHTRFVSPTVFLHGLKTAQK